MPGEKSLSTETNSPTLIMGVLLSSTMKGVGSVGVTMVRALDLLQSLLIFQNALGWLFFISCKSAISCLNFLMSLTSSFFSFTSCGVGSLRLIDPILCSGGGMGLGFDAGSIGGGGRVDMVFHVFL
jgi:hypothetical protein